MDDDENDVTPPIHPHYTLLVNLHNQHLPPDRSPEELFTQEDIDFRSVYAVSLQKAIRMVKAAEMPEGPARSVLLTLLSTVYMDGFQLGYLFAESRTDR